MENYNKTDNNDKLPFEREERKVLVRVRAKTSKKFGCKPEERTTEELLHNGIVNIDKPSGPTSHQVTAYVKEILGLKKAGHSGTLDPRVTGVLPIGLDKATKAMHLLLTAGKEYIAIMHLHKELDYEVLEKTLMSFVGKIKQLPPVKSAVKRAYRTRTVYYIRILEVDDKDVLFKVGVEAGTYIRKLIHDFGIRVGVGAHMTGLRRTKAGPFNEENIFTLQDLRDAFYYYKEEDNDKFLRKIIQPVEKAVTHLPKIWVLDSAVDSICHGANLNVPGISKLNSGINKGDVIAIMTLKDELIAYGIAQLNTKEMLGEKGVAVKPERVFMQPNTYPKYNPSRDA